MKLKVIHLFMLFVFFLIIAPLVSPFVNPLVEGMSHNKEKKEKKEKKGKEGMDSDAYMLKSQIVPPVCPRSCGDKDESSCPPCPPCARCPEPSFDCKKVPNYDINTPEVLDKYLPKPVLTDFSEFQN